MDDVTQISHQHGSTRLVYCRNGVWRQHRSDDVISVFRNGHPYYLYCDEVKIRKKIKNSKIISLFSFVIRPGKIVECFKIWKFKLLIKLYRNPMIKPSQMKKEIKCFK